MGNIERCEYAQGTSLTQRFPWGTYVRGRALCPDGVVRAVRLEPCADTLWTIPAAVQAHGKTVYGHVTMRTPSGLTCAGEPETVVFVPHRWRKNAGWLFVGPPAPGPD